MADRVLSIVLGSAIRAADWAGVERTLRFGEGVGRSWRALRLPRTRRVREQLALAFPEKGESSRRAIEKQVFEHLGLGLAELLLLSGRHRASMLARLEVVGLEHLDRARESAGGKGAIVIGPHLGNWELGAAKLTALGVPVAAVYRGLRNPALERAVRRVRAGAEAAEAEQGLSTLQIPMGRRAGVQFIRALSAGRHVLVLLDQRAHADEGILVRFFGHPASTRAGPLKLAARSGAPVLLAFAQRDADGRNHRLTIEPALQLESGASDDEEVLERNLQQVTALLEQKIRASPGQWIWTHRRWRVRSGSTPTD